MIPYKRVVIVFTFFQVRDGFFRNNLDKKAKPATCKHYLSSLISFMAYCIDDEDFCGSLAINLDVNMIQSMKFRFVNWRSAYNKKQDEQRWVDDEQIQEVLITPEQIKTFEEGEMARKAIKILGQASEDDEFIPTRDEFFLTRDYLLAMIGLTNAHRYNFFRLLHIIK